MLGRRSRQERLLASFAIASLLACASCGEEPPATPASVEPAHNKPIDIGSFSVIGTLPPAPRASADTDGGAAPDGGPRRPVQDADAVIRGGLHPRARACYNAGLKEDPNEQGRVVITIRVGPGGDVTEATAAQCTGLSSKTCACIAGGAKKLVFAPPGGGGSSINAPMNFVKRRSDRATDEVESVFVRDVVPEAQRCYRTALLGDASITGRAKYYATVDGAGVVRSVSADPEPQLPRALLECVANAIKTMKLPPSIDMRVLVHFVPAVMPAGD